MTDPAAPPPPNSRAGDLLQALEVAALIVAGVLIVAWLTNFVPLLDEAIGLAPVVIIALVTMTVLVLVRTLWPRR